MRTMTGRISILIFLAGLFLTVGVGRGQEEKEDAFEKALEGLSWRSIGPADMGGRTVDIAGIPHIFSKTIE